ncbi:pH-response regulator protein palH/rim21 [Ophidiomyces ophidiicola]|nr:pH-response regulator protein palH/rim21 [Ophidiomyces ophidiicola]
MVLPWMGHDIYRPMNKAKLCKPFALAQGGIIVLNETFSFRLNQNAVFKPACIEATRPYPINPENILKSREPFYASTFPQMYAIAAATVISYLLLIMLFITPRTFFIGGRGGTFLTRHGMIGGSYGSSSVIGVGGRPWLQKVAALTVAISLSIATAESFAVAKRQYDFGYMDSMALTNEVVADVEIRVIRVISSTFLWLAQVQTLIRLFPRHKEKVIIKWVGFAMIVLDTIFSILNNAIRRSSNMLIVKPPRHVVDVIPALNYLFELSLSLLYAAWVIFYSISKHRFAFFHVNMRNICLVALLSLVAVLIPVVFFIVDVSKPNVARWGEYIRWVGAAAASVVVWEWVERIEALEREERKDGILGREIFDGDEMIEAAPSDGADPPPDGGGGKGDGKGHGSSAWAGLLGLPHRSLKSRVKTKPRPHMRRRRRRPKLITDASTESSQNEHPAVPPLAVTPVSRTDTASTVYRVRYHSIGSLSPSISELEQNLDPEKNAAMGQVRENDQTNGSALANLAPHRRLGASWLNMLNPFSRRRGSPPQEVASAQAEEGNIRHPTIPPKPPDESQAQPAFKAHLNTFRSLLGRNQEYASGEPQKTASVLPVTVIPARPRLEHARRSNTGSRSDSVSSRSDSRGTPEASLPVVVIPARPRIAKEWDSSAFEEYVRNDYSGGTLATSQSDGSASNSVSTRPSTSHHRQQATARASPPQVPLLDPGPIAPDDAGRATAAGRPPDSLLTTTGGVSTPQRSSGSGSSHPGPWPPSPRPVSPPWDDPGGGR